jgi:hypothetical protein
VFDRLLLRVPALVSWLYRLAPQGLRLRLVEFSGRRAFAAYNRRDWESNTITFHPTGYVFDSAGGPLLPGGPGEYRGVEGYLEAQEEWLSAWGDLRVYPEGMIELGPDRYLSLLRFIGSGGQSGMPLDIAAANLIELRDGWLYRHTHYWNRAAALESLGVDLQRPGRSLLKTP